MQTKPHRSDEHPLGVGSGRGNVIGVHVHNQVAHTGHASVSSDTDDTFTQHTIGHRERNPTDEANRSTPPGHRERNPTDEANRSTTPGRR